MSPNIQNLITFIKYNKRKGTTEQLVNFYYDKEILSSKEQSEWRNMTAYEQEYFITKIDQVLRIQSKIRHLSFEQLDIVEEAITSLNT